MSKTTQVVSLPNGNDLPEGLQEAIDRFFDIFRGNAKEVEEKLYSMLEDAITHEDHCTVYPTGDYLNVYRYTKKLIEALEPFTSNRRTEIWNN